MNPEQIQQMINDEADSYADANEFQADTYNNYHDIRNAYKAGRLKSDEQKDKELVRVYEMLLKYMEAMDNLYNESDIVREVVIKHFGIHHKMMPESVKEIIKAKQLLTK